MKKIDKNQLNLFGPDVWYEFLLAISPDVAASNAVTLSKQKIRKLIGEDAAYLDSRAHISLMTFEHLDPDLVKRKIAGILSAQKNFYVRLKGADFFEPTPESRILHIPIEKTTPIRELVDLLKSGIGKGVKSRNPHLTIAGGLSSIQYQIINSMRSEFAYEGEFLCSGILVLRRLHSQSEGTWNLKEEILFGNPENQLPQ